MRQGPTRISVPMLVCTGCEFHAVSGPEFAQVHRCTHPHMHTQFTGTVGGVYIGMTPKTPDACPLRHEAPPCDCGAAEVGDPLHAATCAAAPVGGEG